MSGLIKSPSTNAEVRTMALRFFQQWAVAFQSKPALAFLVDVYNELKNSGIKFPPPPSGSSAHMLDTATAPTWIDSEFCMRCRTAFTFTNRKHHCRSCGLIFDQACSSKVLPLPQFGIKEEVRVCDSCWNKAGKNKPTPAVPGRTPRTRQDFDADLQKAIELSLAQSHPAGGVPSEPPIAFKSGNVEDDDEQLRLAIEASLRDMERARPSAPTEEPEYKPLPTFDLTPRETETILTFSNTMDQMAAYGERDLRRFPQAHMLYNQAYAIGGKLQRNSEEKTTKQAMLMEMQHKLNEAVSLYGQVLDGQQAYAQRKAQEARQAQYPYQYAPPQHYSPYPQQPFSNGYHVPQGYVPPMHAPTQPSMVAQQQPQPAQPQSNTPSLYPAMPNYAYPQQSYAPPAAGYQSWQPGPQPSTSRQNSYAAAPQQSRQNSYAAPQHTGQSYAPSEQSSYAAAPEPHLPSQATPVPSGPPPIDLASHPSMSPRSITSSLPSAPYPAPSAPARSASYSSPIKASAPLASPISETLPPTSIAATTASAPQHAVAPAPAPVSAPSAPNPWNETKPQQTGYTPSMFPSAPPMFPSAPEGFTEPTAEAPPAREEPLLIEL